MITILTVAFFLAGVLIGSLALFPIYGKNGDRPSFVGLVLMVILWVYAAYDAHTRKEMTFTGEVVRGTSFISEGGMPIFVLVTEDEKVWRIPHFVVKEGSPKIGSQVTLTTYRRSFEDFGEDAGYHDKAIFH